MLCSVSKSLRPIGATSARFVSNSIQAHTASPAAAAAASDSPAKKTGKSTPKAKSEGQIAFERQLDQSRREFRASRFQLQQEVKSKVEQHKAKEEEVLAAARLAKEAAAAASANGSAVTTGGNATDKKPLEPSIERAMKALQQRNEQQLKAKSEQEAVLKAQRKAEWDRNASLMRRMYLREARKLLGRPIPSITQDTLKSLSDPDELERYINSFSTAPPTTSRNVGEDDFWEAEPSK